jgi:hypothetical protein
MKSKLRVPRRGFTFAEVKRTNNFSISLYNNLSQRLREGELNDTYPLLNLYPLDPGKPPIHVQQGMWVPAEGMGNQGPSGSHLRKKTLL